MSAEGIATLVNISAAGAVVAVVLIFLRFIKERDAESRAFFTVIRQADSDASKQLAEVIGRLINRVESLEEKFDRHDATEMEFLRGVVAMLEEKPPPRKRRGPPQ